ncbi:MAG: ATP-dependent Clp protease ATP-binding subunit ClpC [Bacillariaceae sp.]|jgi:ATP-dependent Clp protease ATP-binding subunit ClpC
MTIMAGSFRKIKCVVVVTMMLEFTAIAFLASTSVVDAFLSNKNRGKVIEQKIMSPSVMLTTTTYSSRRTSNTKRMVFERMTEDCIGAIVTAQKQAQKFAQPQVELPFLVAGIVDMPGSSAMERTLKQYGITWRETTAALQKVYPEKEKSSSLGGFFKARDPNDDLPFGKDVQKTLKEAGAIADAMESNTIQTQHLMLAMLEYKEGDPPKAVMDPSTNGAYYLMTRIEPDINSVDLCVSLLGHLQESQDDERELVTGLGSTAKTKTLDEIGVDLTKQAKDGLLDVVQGRDKEINSCIRTLVRRRKNNVCLVGEAGVGKTTVVEGIAQVLVDPKKCPPRLKGTRLVSIELANLVAGTKYRGEFEERLQAIISEVTDPKAPPTILFIDEVRIKETTSTKDIHVC